MAGVAAGIPTTFYSTAGRRNNSAPAGPSNQEPFLRWITAIMDEANPPLVHSSSYSDKYAASAASAGRNTHSVLTDVPRWMFAALRCGCAAAAGRLSCQSRSRTA